ncbi:NADH-quinone oxidoreductase subunit N [Adhaeretor mobilis]|uniref:NADH-quinone oxidoreductase subunit N n=1 Tax=Adhaeretor mobilis TaxID=1930276 RepID=A0A517MUZ9_9BACT|nr:NADH-quinone oxidoreductase subunit N [Adhaeretor mobilis]QDS98712.1 NADH-quinone oxidoreductase subunit N [Adhaeretor mobilis]
MNLQSIINSLVSDTVNTSLPLFKPELVLCVTIVVMLLFRVLPLLDKVPPFLLALVGSVVALWSSLPLEGLSTWANLERQELFTGMLVYDSVTAYMKVFLMSFAVLFVVLSRLTGIADREDGQDYYSLVFGSIVGMCLMASSNHMLTLFLGIEMASVPSYVLAGIVKGRQRSSEAALKYCIYGAGTAGVMLYGISLLSGVLGSAHIPTMAQRLVEMDIPASLAAGEGVEPLIVLVLGGLMMGVGLAFKLSAIPFHFWCPDVFEGASAEVDGFLSVASKAAALALLLRVGLGLGYSPEAELAAVENRTEVTAIASAAEQATPPTIRLVADGVADELGEEAPGEISSPLTPIRKFFVTVVALIAIVTCTFGNLAAYGQTNIKRMLAYSTIAHAGFMMMPVAAAVSLAGHSTAEASDAVSAMLFYVAIYLFMNLGAFAIIAFLRNSMQSEEISDYAGLINKAPWLAVCMTVILFSLVGLPPLAGFWPKLRVLQALLAAGGPLLIAVLVTAALNTAISLVYYLRVAKTICIDSEPDTSRPVAIGFFPWAYVLVITLPVLIFGLLPNGIAAWAKQAADNLF